MPIETVLVLSGIVAAFGVFTAVVLRASLQTDALLRVRASGRP